ncbi:hypothetical protein ACQKM2_20265 [Streptomyces sp. NPDC004126]|uniref:hypothetical protein n=1 Tax=Streptomyces sp. NPDC004126 TaxID=3390695 RepID=UPI003D0939FA
MSESVPPAGVVREEWRKAVVDERGRVERIPYELCVLVSLRDALRRREIRVQGAGRTGRRAGTRVRVRAGPPPARRPAGSAADRFTNRRASRRAGAGGGGQPAVGHSHGSAL